MDRQTTRVYEFIKTNGGITTLDAIKFLGITRLSARIYDLKKDYEIGGRPIFVKNRFGEEVRVKCYTILGKKKSIFQSILDKMKMKGK